MVAAAAMDATAIRAAMLADLEPLLVAANVRGQICRDQVTVGAGTGGTGHLVLGEIRPRSGQRVDIADSDRRLQSFATPQRVVAVLGPRDSSTSVCATIPPGGVAIDGGTELSWIGGASGIVGVLERDAHADSVHGPELAARFVCSGMLFHVDGTPLHIREFAVRPEATALTTPVVLIAATSTHAGKTVLAKRLIERLVERGLRVGAIKATGAGGVMDSIQHAAGGARETLDHVDAGLITTHGDADEVREQVPLVFRAAQDRGVDVIIAELGGDLVSAGNPEILAIPEILDNARLMLVICNDALAAAGVQHINDTRLRFPASKIRYLTSPFRNHPGMLRRMRCSGVTSALDPRSHADLSQLADDIADPLTA
jgi:hypothetical protein